ncbi:e3fbb43a-4594-4298-85b5-bceb5e26b472 [Thermothielavioides terrestris]|uniref:E3fbb43a-4594-4298-85b5-bceb5e26b472 n=1 Tax=Thermothielavioides terrestris TaxID=2587410 RepID=A0A446BG58_9PEZI|nr:e3fbb43a-4594-4298-85b5-bceb5e26b472 [Thermothielavioides terrestris]
MRIRLRRVPLRRAPVLWAVALLTVLAFSISRLSASVHIFFRHAGIALTQPQIAAAHHDKNSVQHVPKIIHHIFHNWREPGNDALPPHWAETRKHCMELNPDFEFKLWTDNNSREFIETEYAWFLRTYDGYRYPVQRVDALKYFLMLHYGGIYLDLDNTCKVSLKPLLYYPAWVTDGARGALSNNILAARPHHPFWQLVTVSLARYDWKWPLPYVSVMYASGQWFLTAIWEQYHALLPRPAPGAGQNQNQNQDPAQPQPHEHRLYRVLMDGRPGADEWVFFGWDGSGGTWNNWDNRLFWSIGQYPLLYLAGLLGVTVLLAWLVVRCVRRYQNGYSLLPSARPASDAA